MSHDLLVNREEQMADTCSPASSNTAAGMLQPQAEERVPPLHSSSGCHSYLDVMTSTVNSAGPWRAWWRLSAPSGWCGAGTCPGGWRTPKRTRRGRRAMRPRAPRAAHRSSSTASCTCRSRACSRTCLTTCTWGPSSRCAGDTLQPVSQSAFFMAKVLPRVKVGGLRLTFDGEQTAVAESFFESRAVCLP